MKLQDKISKLAFWIAFDSNDRLAEIEWLLYAFYNKDGSGLSGDIDEDYGDIFKYIKIDEDYKAPYDNTDNKTS